MIAPVAADYRKLAQARLPRLLFDYAEGGAYDEVTARENVEAWATWRLRQRVMCDVSDIDTSTTLFGRKMTMPVALAPVGMAGLYARRGEVQAARAAATAGIPFSLSTVSICAIEEVAAASAAPVWMQLYMIRDRGFMAELLKRAANAGCDTLLLTVDLPAPGARYRDTRSGMYGGLSLAEQIGKFLDVARRPGWVWDVFLRGRPHLFGNVAPVMQNARNLADFWVWVKANFDPGVTWTDLDWVRQHWSGRIVVKGVLDVEDARLAKSAGADGIIVSNHGGRQLDGVAPSAQALPQIAEALAGEIPLLVDGGIRSGLDVLKALALGADACLIGRAWLYALACGGELAVGALLTAMQAELRLAMMMTGTTRVGRVGRRILETVV